MKCNDTHIYELLTALLVLTFHLKGIYLLAWRIREEGKRKEEEEEEKKKKKRGEVRKAEEGSCGEGGIEEEVKV